MALSDFIFLLESDGAGQPVWHIEVNPIMGTTGRVPVEGLANSFGEARLVWAPSPQNRTLAVRLFTSPDTADQMGADQRDGGLAMYAGHIHGAVAYTDLRGNPQAKVGRGLLEARALFRGIHRPMIDKELDNFVYVYILNPDHTYVYPPARRRLRLGPLQAEKPLYSVFTIFVLFHDESIRRWRAQINRIGGEEIDGLILDWEWAFASSPDGFLPDDHENRYDERIW